MNELRRRLLIGVLSLAIIQLPIGTLTAADEEVKINHCAPGRGGELNCKELSLPAEAAAAHLAQHPHDSEVPPPDNCDGSGGVIIWGDCGSQDPGGGDDIVWGT